jgi:hypothetical protein
MADLLLATQSAPTGRPSSGQVIGFFDTTKKRWASMDDAGVITYYPMQIRNAAVASVAGAYAADTYLAGSSITIPVAGDWVAAETYSCLFDMTKTAAGTAAFTITVRMGTAGTTADAAILTLAFAVGTAAVDTGLFEVLVTFRTIGTGTTAAIAGVARCTHHLAATGLVSTGASGTGIVLGTSAGFDSSTPTVIGLSVNGGASFSGTTTLVQSRLGKAA